MNTIKEVMCIAIENCCDCGKPAEIQAETNSGKVYFCADCWSADPDLNGIPVEYLPEF